MRCLVDAWQRSCLHHTERATACYIPRRAFCTTSASRPSDNNTYEHSDHEERSSKEAHTHFGFRSVPLRSKQSLVESVFSSVASSYDIMNDLMSAGTHRLWKDAFVADLAPTSHMQVLDCAGGTGDIAFRVLNSRNASRARTANESAQPVIVCDVNEHMLAIGRERAQRMHFTNEDVRFMQGNAENLPFPDNSFDAYLISFGMRNVSRPQVAVDEALRVLKPTGRFMMLEFAKVSNSSLAALYDAYSFRVIPTIGQMVAGDRQSYQYLVESIRKFPSQQQFLQIMNDAGLHCTSVRDYSLGIAACYSGFKPLHCSTKSAKRSRTQSHTN